MTHYTVSTSGTGLVVREVRDTNATVYSDHIVATFDTWDEAEVFATQHDNEYWDDL